MYTKKNSRGFTLIELLVVIAIIGVLSSVVLASLNTARQKSRDAKRQADIKQLQIALELYFDANSSYPNQATAAAVSGISAALTPTYIASIPSDPLAGGAYFYQSSAASNSTSYCVGANLEGSSGALDTCGTPDVGPTYEYRVGP